MSGPHVEEALEEALLLQQGGFVELLLAQVVVVVHGVHEGADHVDGRVGDAEVVPLERIYHLQADSFSETTTGTYTVFHFEQRSTSYYLSANFVPME